MAKYRTALPQLGEGVFLCYTGMETDLIFNRGVDLPGFASYPLLETDQGRETLRGYCAQQVDLARRMVCEWGMSDKMGPLTFGRKQEEIFLGREIAQHRDYSEQTAQMIDSEVKRIVVEAEDKARALLKANLDKLKRIAKALLDREILDGHELDQLIDGEDLPAPTVTPSPAT